MNMCPAYPVTSSNRLPTDHPKRLCNSLQTLCSLFYSIYRKSASDNSFDLLAEFFDYKTMDKWLKQLVEHCNQLLLGKLINA